MAKKFIILPPVENYPSRKEWEAACWLKILKSKELLDLIITSDGRHDLVMRAAAMSGILSGKTYSQISNDLWLSPQTISSIKRALGGGIYKNYKERSKGERKKKAYGSKPKHSTKKEWHNGWPHRTKYGTIYIRL